MEDINISYGVQVLGPDEDPQIKWTRIRKPFPFFFFFTAQILTCWGRGDSGKTQ